MIFLHSYRGVDREPLGPSYSENRFTPSFPWRGNLSRHHTRRYFSYLLQSQGLLLCSTSPSSDFRNWYLLRVLVGPLKSRNYSGRTFWRKRLFSGTFLAYPHCTVKEWGQWIITTWSFATSRSFCSLCKMRGRLLFTASQRLISLSDVPEFVIFFVITQKPYALHTICNEILSPDVSGLVSRLASALVVYSI